MPWCPNCKLEYGEGIKICPDCKTALVDSLEEAEADENFDFSDEYNAVEDQIEGELCKYFPDLSEEEREDMLENMKKGALIPHVGVLGVAFVVLNALKLLSLPIANNTLTNVVMGALFLIFLLSGIFSFVKASKLKPQAEAEKDLINRIVEHVRTQKAAGAYPTVKAEGEEFEFDYIKLTDAVVKDVEDNFADLEPGFAYYVVDRFASAVLDED